MGVLGSDTKVPLYLCDRHMLIVKSYVNVLDVPPNVLDIKILV